MDFHREKTKSSVTSQSWFYKVCGGMHLPPNMTEMSKAYTFYHTHDNAFTKSTFVDFCLVLNE